MTKKKDKQQRLPGVIDEIGDIRKIIAEGRDEIQGNIESLSAKIQSLGHIVDAKREREEELNDALRKLDHLQTLKDRLKETLDRNLELSQAKTPEKKKEKKKK